MGFDMFLCPAHNNFWIDIGLPYLAHGSITMKVCITYIHDPDTILTFDLKVKFIGFMTWICVQASAFSSFDIAILYLARECITIVRYVTYIHELCITLTFDLNIKIFIYLSLSRCLAPWHRHTKLWHMGWEKLRQTYI